MAAIEPPRKDVQRPGKIKNYSSSLRLWHWANAIVISGSLITVLINSTILDGRKTSALVTGELHNAGATVTPDQARSVSHALGDSVWAIHTYFGYVLAGLLAFRLILELFQLADQKFIGKLKTAYKDFVTVKKQRQIARHELTVKLLYAVFYLLLIIMAVTGLFLAFEDQLQAYKAIRPTVKNIHGFCMYLILAFIVVHLAGVFLAERKDSKGIVSDMINGGGSSS